MWCSMWFLAITTAQGVQSVNTPLMANQSSVHLYWIRLDMSCLLISLVEPPLGINEVVCLSVCQVLVKLTWFRGGVGLPHDITQLSSYWPTAAPFFFFFLIAFKIFTLLTCVDFELSESVWYAWYYSSQSLRRIYLFNPCLSIHLTEAPTFADHPHVFGCAEWEERGRGAGPEPLRDLQRHARDAALRPGWHGRERAARQPPQPPVQLEVPQVCSGKATRSTHTHTITQRLWTSYWSSTLWFVLDHWLHSHGQKHSCIKHLYQL